MNFTMEVKALSKKIGIIEQPSPKMRQERVCRVPDVRKGHDASVKVGILDVRRTVVSHVVGILPVPMIDNSVICETS